MTTKVKVGVIAENAVDTAQIVESSVTTAVIAGNAVVSAKIAANQIIATKIAGNAIESGHITSGEVGTAHLANSAITTDKIAANAITLAKITSGTLTADSLADNSITGAKIALNSIDSSEIVTGSIDTIHIADSQVTNAKLANSSVTVNSNEVSLGSSITLDTDDVGEGSTNQYFTNARAQGAITVTDAGGDGSLGYSSGTITYTGPSAAETRAHFSAGTGVGISSGEISIGQAVATTDSPTFNDLTLDGDLNLTGDLNITGDLNTLTVTDLDVVDKTITLGAGQVESASGGSGIIVDGSSASILWDETNTEFDINNPIHVAGGITFGTADSTLADNNIRFKSTGAAYIDHNTVGQDINFRISNASSLDTTIMTLDAGVGSVGINQTSPSSTYKLDVGGAIRSNAAAPGLTLRETDASNQEWIVGSYGGTFAIRDVTGGTYPVYVEQTTPSSTLYLDSSGNVGIGTSSPRVELNVQNGSNASSYTGAGPGDIIRASGSGAGNWIASEDDGAMAYFGIDSGRGKFAAYNYATTTEMNMIFGQDRMFIKNDGKVGIGTTNPNSILHINSSFNDTFVDINGPASQYTGLKLFRGNGDWASIAHNHFGLLVSDIGLEVSRFTGANATGRSQIMVFDGTNERVGINMNSPAYDLDVNGSMAFRSASYAYDAPFYAYDSGNGTYLGYDTTTGGRGRITMQGAQDLLLQTNAGNVGIGTTDATEALHIERSTGNGPEIKMTNASVSHYIRSYNNNLNIIPQNATYGFSMSNNGEVCIGNDASSSALRRTRRFNVDGSSSNKDGVHVLSYNGANTYQCAYHMMTAAGGTIYAHIETSISTQSNIMFRAHFTGYNYGTASVIDMHGVGYAYQPSNAVIAGQAVNNGGDSNQELVYYTSNNNRVVLRFKVGASSSYYCGFLLHMEFAQPTGYNHEFTIVQASWTSSSANQF